MEIILLILFGAITIFILYHLFKTMSIMKKVRSGSGIVYGAKGRGKDLFFQYIVNGSKKKILSNLSYGKKSTVIALTDIELENNSYKNFLSGNYCHEIKREDWENTTLLVSDSGLYFPNFADQILKKQYESMPTYFALSRQLYNQNIITNVQDISRMWALLEEQQQDYYIRCLGVIDFGFFMVGKCCYYDNFVSAQMNLKPLGVRGLKNEQNRADIERQKADNGVIKEFYYLILKKSIKYDTRAFHQILFDKPAPKKVSLLHKIKSKFKRGKK